MDEQRVIVEFRALFARDVVQGGIRELATYQRLFPGFEQVVAAELERLTALESDATVVASAEATSSDPSQAGAPDQGLPGLLEPGRARFRDDGEIARGGMGAIVRLHDAALNRDLAKKLILPAGASRPDLVARFLDEARVTAQLTHPGVVPVHDVGLDSEGRLFFTMKLVEGRTFEEVVERVGDPDSTWSLQRALQTFLRICETLAFAHSRGVIHRDLKPANVMVGNFGEVYVMDWGLAKVLGEAPTDHAGDASTEEPRRGSLSGVGRSGAMQTVAGSIVGTPAFMSPEQAAGQVDSLDARSDIYSLGAMLYHLLGGRAPYETESGRSTALETVARVVAGPPGPLVERAPATPPELIAIVEKAMARAPGDRYPDAEALRADVQAFLENRVVAAYRTGALVEFRKWVGRNRALAATLLCGVVLALGGTIGFALYQRTVAEDMQAERDKEARARQDAEEAERLAEAARAEEARERRRADGLRLVAEADHLIDSNPAWALALSTIAAERAPGAAANGVVYRALLELTEVHTLRGQNGPVRFVQFTADDRRIVAGGDFGSPYATVWDAATGAFVGRLDAHTGDAIRHLVVSPDGRVALTCGTDGTARLWDLDTLSELRVEDIHRSVVLCGAFSPSGDHFATGTADGVVRVFDGSRRRDPIHTFAGHVHGVRAIAFSMDGERFLTLDGTGACRVHALEGGEARTLFQLPVGSYTRLNWDPQPLVGWPSEGRVIAWIGREAMLWDLETAAAIDRPTRTNSLQPTWSADARSLFVPCETPEQGVCGRVFDTRTGELTTEIRGIAGVRGGRFSPDGETLLALHHGPNAGTGARLYSLPTGAPLRDLLGHRYWLTEADFAADGRIVTGAGDSTARVWRPQGRFRGTTVQREDGRPTLVLDVSPDGLLALRETHDTDAGQWQLELVDTDTGASLESHVVTWQCYARFSPDGRWFAFHDIDRGRAVLREVGSDRRLELECRPDDAAPRTRYFAASFDAESSRVAVHDGRGPLRIYSLETGEQVRTFAEDDPHLRRGAFSPDGMRFVLTHGRSRAVSVWDVESGEPVHHMTDHVGWSVDAVYSRDGRYFATSAADESVRLYDADTFVCIAVVSQLEQTGLRIAFSDDGTTLVVRSPTEVVLLNVPDLSRRATIAGDFPRHPAAIRFSADSSSVVLSDATAAILEIPLSLDDAMRWAPEPRRTKLYDEYDVESAEWVLARGIEELLTAEPGSSMDLVHSALTELTRGQDRELAMKFLDRAVEVRPRCALAATVRAFAAATEEDVDREEVLAAIHRALELGADPGAVLGRPFMRPFADLPQVQEWIRETAHARGEW